MIIKYFKKIIKKRIYIYIQINNINKSSNLIKLNINKEGLSALK